jgi:hypothetical protein
VISETTRSDGVVFALITSGISVERRFVVVRLSMKLIPANERKSRMEILVKSRYYLSCVRFTITTYMI